MLPFQFAEEPSASEKTIEGAIRWTDQLWAKVADADMWFNILFSSIRIIIIFIIIIVNRIVITTVVMMIVIDRGA